MSAPTSLDLIVQAGDWHHECAGLVIEFLLRQPTPPQGIDVFSPPGSHYPYAPFWIKFFTANFAHILPIRFIDAVPADHVYRNVVYLSSQQQANFPFHFPHQAFCLAHIQHLISSKPLTRNLRLSPLVQGNAELIPYHFRCFKPDYVPDLFPHTRFFINSDQNHHQVTELLRCFEQLAALSTSSATTLHQQPSASTDTPSASTTTPSTAGSATAGSTGCAPLLFVNRNSFTIEHPLVENATHISVDKLISLYLHKTLICYPPPDSWHMRDRISGAIHLSASFRTPTLMWRPLFDIYASQIRKNRFPVTPFADTPSLLGHLCNKPLSGVLIEPRDMKNVVTLVHNFYSVLKDLHIPLHFYCGKGLESKWRTRLAAFPAIRYFELPTRNLSSDHYSDLMKEPAFWNRFDTVHVLVIQTDGCLAPDSTWTIRDFMCYDYVGGYAREGWWWKETQGLHPREAAQCFSGGVSFRNVHACKQVLTAFPPLPSRHFYHGLDFKVYAEDIYFVVGMLHLKKAVALDHHGTQFCSQNSLVHNSFAIHKLDVCSNPHELAAALLYCPEFASFTQAATANLFQD